MPFTFRCFRALFCRFKRSAAAFSGISILELPITCWRPLTHGVRLGSR